MVKEKQKKLLIAQEIKFARVLSSNDKKARAKMVKKLQTWIAIRSKSSFAFTEADFMRLWKGLFYCMWMSDKPLLQEELAESISNLFHSFKTMEPALLYTKCTLKTLSTEWFGIDRYRMDKFEMLVRRIIRQTFVMCKNQSWDEEWVKGVGKVIEEILLDDKGSLGLKLHITELYMEEFAKISEGKIDEDIVTELLRPFAIYLAAMTDDRQISHVIKYIFRYLIFQSDVGLDYAEKFEAWRKAGFPTGHIEAMQKVELSDDEESINSDIENNDDEEDSNKEKVLDPRAGRVDVELPQVPFCPKQIANLLQSYKFNDLSTAKNRRRIVKLITEFNELADGNMPLGIKEVELINRKNKDMKPKNAALKLLNFQNKLYSDSNSRKRKKKNNQAIIDEIHDEANDTVMSNDSEIEESSTPAKKKSKKQRSESNVTDNDSDNHNDSKDEKIEFHNEKIIKQKRKKKLINNKDDATSKAVLPKKVKESLPTKNTKLKDKKIKIKKLKSKQKNLKNFIRDGIEDFVNFKQSTELKVKKKKKKKAITDVENSENLFNTKSSSTSAAANITVSQAPSLFIKKPSIERVMSNNISSKKANIHKKSQVIVTSPPNKRQNGTVPVMVVSPSKKKSSDVESTAKKRVKIVLHRNTAQHTSEYIKQLRSSPAIPFDANRKPPSGVLKPSPISSPINPFYRKKSKLL